MFNPTRHSQNQNHAGKTSIGPLQSRQAEQKRNIHSLDYLDDDLDQNEYEATSSQFQNAAQAANQPHNLQNAYNKQYATNPEEQAVANYLNQMVEQMNKQFMMNSMFSLVGLGVGAILPALFLGAFF